MRRTEDDKYGGREGRNEGREEYKRREKRGRESNRKRVICVGVQGEFMCSVWRRLA